ncbi:MAG: hypothetical protein HKN08_11085, partial [Gammaproteobacteria bacterium]|nr:hypothetical protein [Gammaproteobacteria bacterium]
MLEKQTIVAAFYKFIRLDDHAALRPEIMALCEQQNIKGTILLAAEGINATVSGSREAIDQLRIFLNRDSRFEKMEYKESLFDKDPFYRMKVKLKKEIVTLGVPGSDPNNKTGRYVASNQWNELISDPDVLVIDVRNNYECE